MTAPLPIRLGINIDHIATLRNARGGHHPDPLRAALVAIEAGADNITAHLREDRRHITDEDIERLAANLTVPLNMEMAATPEMLTIALKTRPHACCLVPEKRTERTTEGGLEVAGQHDLLRPVVAQLGDAGIRVSLFIAPELHQIEAAARLRAPAIEIHVGPWCEALSKYGRSAVLALRGRFRKYSHSASRRSTSSRSLPDAAGRRASNSLRACA